MASEGNDLLRTDVSALLPRRRDAWATQDLDSELALGRAAVAHLFEGGVPDVPSSASADVAIPPPGSQEPSPVPEPPTTEPLVEAEAAAAAALTAPALTTPTDDVAPRALSVSSVFATAPFPAFVPAAARAAASDAESASIPTSTPASILDTVVTERDTIETPEPDEVATDDDAYFHPGGRIRSIVDVTDGWHRDQTVQTRPVHMNRTSWLVAGLVAVLVPLVMLSVILGVRRLSASAPPAHRAAHTPDWTRTPLVHETTSHQARAVVVTHAGKGAPKARRPGRRPR